MYLIPFSHLFPEIAHPETRMLSLIGLPGIPASDYALSESYCPDPQCDCQRVMLNIFSRSEQKQVATISYGFDRSAKQSGPYLDVLNPQSPYSDAILAFITRYLETDHAYVLLLKTHYALIKAAAADPNHPAQQKLTEWKAEEQRLLAKNDLPADLQKALRDISEDEPAFVALERKASGMKRRRHRARGGKKTDHKSAE